MNINDNQQPVGGINSGNLIGPIEERGDIPGMKSLPAPESSPGKINSNDFLNNVREMDERYNNLMQGGPEPRCKTVLTNVMMLGELIPASLGVIAQTHVQDQDSLNLLAKGTETMFKSYLIQKTEVQNS